MGRDGRGDTDIGGRYGQSWPQSPAPVAARATATEPEASRAGPLTLGATSTRNGLLYTSWLSTSTGSYEGSKCRAGMSKPSPRDRIPHSADAEGRREAAQRGPDCTPSGEGGEVEVFGADETRVRARQSADAASWMLPDRTACVGVVGDRRRDVGPDRQGRCSRGGAPRSRCATPAARSSRRSGAFDSAHTAAADRSMTPGRWTRRDVDVACVRVRSARRWVDCRERPPRPSRSRRVRRLPRRRARRWPAR